MIHYLKKTALLLLPHHLLSRAVQWGARCRRLPLRRLFTRWFIRFYHVDMSEALHPDPDSYPDFNAFFTRALRPQVRPVAQHGDVICCPSDGAISQLGEVVGEQILQAKGHNYTLSELLGNSEARAQPFIGGCFATTYLSPGDYHRVHMPLSGRLLEMVYIPGRLFSVAPEYVESIPRLFSRNERVVCLFQTAAGLMCVILVGAIFVGSLQTVWAGEITPPRARAVRVTHYASDDSPVRLERGEELGRFNMGGSTIIVLFEADRVQWLRGLGAGSRVQFGQELGRLKTSNG